MMRLMLFTTLPLGLVVLLTTTSQGIHAQEEGCEFGTWSVATADECAKYCATTAGCRHWYWTGEYDGHCTLSGECSYVPNAPPQSQDVEIPNQSTTQSTQSGMTDAEQQEMLERINSIRGSAGLGPLSIDPILMTVAQLHSEDQASHCDMRHEGSTGTNPSDRAQHKGYGTGVAENVAAGQTTVEEAMTTWINSPGHLENLLNADTTRVGYGKAANAGCDNYGVYWTQNFASI